jgi:hypothetical protein
VDQRNIHLAAVRELIGAGAEWKPVLWGDLGGMPAADLLEILTHGRRSGLLLVLGDDDSERALAMHEGHVTFQATSEPLEREPSDIVFGLIRLRAGQFTFLRGPVPQGEGPSTQELLLDGLRRLDEAEWASN